MSPRRRTVVVSLATCFLMAMSSSLVLQRASASIVGNYAVSSSCNGVTACSVAGFSTSGPNDLIIVSTFVASSSVRVTSVNDTAGLTWSLRRAVSDGYNNHDLEEWYAVSSSTLSSDTIQAHYSASSTGGVLVASIPGADTAAPFDPASASARTYGGTASSSPSVPVTTTGTNDVMIGLLTCTSSATATAGAGFQQVNGGQCYNNEPFMEYQAVTTAESSMQVGFSISASTTWEVIGDAVAMAGSTSSSSDSSSTSSTTSSSSSITTTSSTTSYAIEKKAGGLLFFDPLNNVTMSQQQLEAQGRYIYNGDAQGENAHYSFNEDSQGLHIGVQAPAQGTWAGFFAAESNFDQGQLFHLVTTAPSRTVPAGFYSAGLYVQTGSGKIDYVFCGEQTSTVGTNWGVSYATSNNDNSTTNLQILYYDNSANQPLTRSCTIVTNGSNSLEVYLDNVLVFSSTTLNLQFARPLQTYIEVENSYAGAELSGTFTDFYATTTDGVTLQNAPPGDTALVTDASGTPLSSSTVAENGTALLDVEMDGLPITGNIEVYDSSYTLVASTTSTATIWGGDTYAVGTSLYMGLYPPSAPTGLAAKVTSPSQIALSWTTPSKNGGSPITGYMIQRSTTGGAWKTVVPNTGSTSTSYSDTGLSGGTTYAYQVSALNSVGASPPSTTASETTYPPTTSNLTVSTVNSVGTAMSGFYITLWQNGVTIASCFSPCTFTVNNGQTYQVAAASYGSETFSHWQNDGSTGFETVTVPSKSTTISLTAAYTP